MKFTDSASRALSVSEGQRIFFDEPSRLRRAGLAAQQDFVVLIRQNKATRWERSENIPNPSLYSEARKRARSRVNEAVITTPTTSKSVAEYRAKHSRVSVLIPHTSKRHSSSSLSACLRNQAAR